MPLQIPIFAVMYPPRLFPARERRIVFNIPGVLRVMRALIRRMLTKPQTFFFKTQSIVPIKRKIFPILKLFFGGLLIRPYIILKLHLLKLALAEKKIARCNFISKRLAYLPDAERQLRMHRVQYIFKIYMHSLGYLTPEICFRCALFGCAKPCLHKQIKNFRL